MDVILEYEWLKSLKGDVGLSRTMASLKAIRNELKGEVKAYYVELGMITVGCT